MTKVRYVLLACLAVTAGCGGSAPGASYGGEDMGDESEAGAAEGESAWQDAEPTFQFSAADEDAIALYDSDFRGWLGEFQDAVPQSSGSDCDLGRDLADRICELSERICEIADRHPEQPSARNRCEDGRAGCQESREELDEHCG